MMDVISYYFRYFYPRPPRGGRLQARCRPFTDRAISIHALRKEGDADSREFGKSRSYFYPRPPRGGRRPSGADQTCHCCISIHALREEGDCVVMFRRLCPTHFYPRPPRGGRLSIILSSEDWYSYFYPRPPRGGRPARNPWTAKTVGFLSTPSARRATPCSGG